MSCLFGVPFNRISQTETNKKKLPEATWIPNSMHETKSFFIIMIWITTCIFIGIFIIHFGFSAAPLSLSLCVYPFHLISSHRLWQDILSREKKRVLQMKMKKSIMNKTICHLPIHIYFLPNTFVARQINRLECTHTNTRTHFGFEMANKRFVFWI